MNAAFRHRAVAGVGFPLFGSVTQGRLAPMPAWVGRPGLPSFALLGLLV